MTCHGTGCHRLTHPGACSYKTHLEFKAPKASMDIRFLLPATAATLQSQLCATLFSLLLADDLNEIAYEAELAGVQSLPQRTKVLQSHPLPQSAVRSHVHQLTRGKVPHKPITRFAVEASPDVPPSERTAALKTVPWPVRCMQASSLPNRPRQRPMPPE
jgi:hypothetical protein